MKIHHNIYINFKKGYIIYFNNTNNQLQFNNDDFSFTRTLELWKESTTMKLKGSSIAEFQVHNKRNGY
jgi:hypothetical protein